MDLMFKNDGFAAVIDRLEKEDEKPTFGGRTEQQMGEDLIVTYAMDILRNGMWQNKTIRFAYTDFQDLPVAVAACYRSFRNENTVQEAAIGTAKSLAAYFFALAWNEQNIAPTVRRPVLLDTDKACGPDVWGVFTVRANGEDFLRAVNAGCRKTSANGKRLLMFDLSSLMTAFKKATGVDLSEKGLPNIVFDR